jgi:Protein of unknown function (DUF723).
MGKIKRVSNTEEFKKKAQSIHGIDKYDYSLVKYKKSNIKVDIICPKHGVFKQRPFGHLSGKGCERCARELVHYNQMTTTTFIEKAKKIYNQYDYSLVAYKKSWIKIKIICLKHGPFEVTSNNHLRNMGGCPKCAEISRADKRRFSTQEFLERATKKFGDRYDYSMVDYQGIEKKVKIICKLHGPFLMTPGCHLMKKGCPICGKWSLLTTEIFKERCTKIHGGIYDYSLVDYKNCRTKVKIICKKHGIFEQRPQAHFKGSGCAICLESQGEKKISLFLENHKTAYERERSFEGCRDKNPLQFDFYLPDHNTCIEFDGLHHFQPVDYFGGERVFKETKKHDRIKNNFCADNGIRLVRIPHKIKDINSILEKEILGPITQVYKYK